MDSKIVWQTVAIIGASVLVALVTTKVGRMIAAHAETLVDDAVSLVDDAFGGDEEPVEPIEVNAA